MILDEADSQTGSREGEKGNEHGYLGTQFDRHAQDRITIAIISSEPRSLP